MTSMAAVEIKAFVPAKDFELSKRFYIDLGFELAWASDDLAYFQAGHSSFLLQRFYVKEHAENFMMHMLVNDVEAWWHHVSSNQIGKKYGVRVLPPADRPWGIRDFTVDDPTGVLWRIGQNIERAEQSVQRSPRRRGSG
jgi:catechol 2,3-dioxygenase-like lactoylglutathione lyase family enzyme